MRFFSSVFLFLFLFLVCYDCVNGKECTNTPTALSSHTLRYQLLNSDNNTWKENMFHDHLTPTDESAWASLLPRKVLKQEDVIGWIMMYKQMKNNGGGSKFKDSGNFLNEVPLSDVRLHADSVHGQAQQTNLEYLLLLSVDSLAYSFRQTAGLPSPGTPHGGWEYPTQELRGHFVGKCTSQVLLFKISTYIVVFIYVIIDNYSVETDLHGSQGMPV